MCASQLGLLAKVNRSCEVACLLAPCGALGDESRKVDSSENRRIAYSRRQNLCMIHRFACCAASSCAVARKEARAQRAKRKTKNSNNDFRSLGTRRVSISPNIRGEEGRAEGESKVVLSCQSAGFRHRVKIIFKNMSS